MNKILHFIILPFILYIILLLVLFYKVYDCDLKITIDGSILVVQSLAIIIGGFWAYHKFGWEKKCENIITLKLALMEYNYKHNWSASQFHGDKDVAGYKIRILNAYKDLKEKLYLSYYVPIKLRKKIEETISLTIGNSAGKNHENIFENWKKFEKELEEIFEEFDKITAL